MGQKTAHVLSTWIKLFTTLVQKHTAASVIHWEISKKMSLDKNVQLLVPHCFQGGINYWDYSTESVQGHEEKQNAIATVKHSLVSFC